MAVSNVELRVNATQAVAALRKVNKGATTFNQTVNGTSGKLKQANKGFSILPPALLATGAGAKVAAGGFATLQAALAPILAPLIGLGAVIGGLTASFGILTKQDFAEAKLSTLSDNVDELKPKLVSLSDELSGQASTLDLLTASYDLASAGFAKNAEITEILKAAQLGATGGFSDLGTVTDATTSVLNAYGLEADKAAKIVDGFAQTQADGKIVVDQYAQQIGRIAPIAAGAGVSIDELNAAISAVTATGVPVESTFAGLRQVIASIQKPTGEASKVAQKLGIDFSAAALQSKGLGGVLEEIIAKGGASADNLSKLFGSVEALTAIQPLLNDELVKFNQALDNQANAQGRAARDAFKATNTIQGQLKRLSSAFTNLVADGSEFGIVIRETLKITAVTVEALGLAVKATFAPFRALFAFIGEISNAVIGEFGGEAIDIVIGFEKAWIFVKNAINENIKRITELGRKAGQVVGKIVRAIFDAFNKIKNFVENNPVLKFLLGQIQKIMPKIDIQVEGDDLKDLKKDIDEATDGANKLSDAFKKVGDNIATGVSDALTDAIMQTRSLADAAKSLLQSVARQLLQLGINTFLFSAFGGSSGLFKNLPTFASGGRPKVGQPSIVGEKGAELFVPSRAGTIIPNDQLGGGGLTNNIVVNVDVSGGVDVQGGEEEGRELGRLIAVAVQSEIIQQKRAGGLLA
ncbi:MAG: phage tail tape measure protein [Maricaulis sp.]|nr:phage tail tape measure protein [Maricaulis sp.]